MLQISKQGRGINPDLSNIEIQNLTYVFLKIEFLSIFYQKSEI